jgi:DNA-binding NtrC family response regulator
MTIKSQPPSDECNHILLVDDDADMLRLIKTHLGSGLRREATISAVCDPTEAAEVIRRNPIDVIITDLEMSEVNGFHLLKEVKKRDLFTPVVILTAHQSLNALESALALGADEFFVKPVNKESLVETVEYLLGRLHRWREQVIA